MDRTVVLDTLGSGEEGIVWILGLRRRRLERVFGRGIGVGTLLGGLDGRERFGAQRSFHRFTGCGFGAFSARRRNLCPFEFVVRVAGGAASLLDLILDHGHHGMTGDATLAGTVVVQNVTEPKPALLH
jgi:hypothetical protein